MKIATDKQYKIFAEVLEQGALDQFNDALSHPAVLRGALMPDSHTGYTLPIGSVVACRDMVFPSFVGYDIGCGMCALPTSFDVERVSENAKSIFDGIYRDIPVGFSHNKKDSIWDCESELPRTPDMQRIFNKNGLRQMGSLGGGNHFIEIGADETGRVWVIIHSGSRGIGHAVASHYMRIAGGGDKVKEGCFGLDVNYDDGKAYITDMNFCLAFALENRKEMMRRIVNVMQSCIGYGSAYWDELINRNHNHAELRDGEWIHRKGATHAEKGMMGVIPGNMRDGSFIVRGKGNPDALWSSSHGAGRVLGRKEASRVLNMADFKSSMIGITARIDADTLDESPFAYKDIFSVMAQQSDLVEVLAHVKPIINIKG